VAWWESLADKASGSGLSGKALFAGIFAASADYLSGSGTIAGRRTYLETVREAKNVLQSVMKK